MLRSQICCALTRFSSSPNNNPYQNLVLCACVVIVYRCHFYCNFGVISIFIFCILICINMSSSPKRSYQSQIDTLTERLDHQDERFDQLEAKIDKLTRAFEKLPMLDQPQTPEPWLSGSRIVPWNHELLHASQNVGSKKIRIGVDRDLIY